MRSHPVADAKGCFKGASAVFQSVMHSEFDFNFGNESVTFSWKESTGTVLWLQEGCSISDCVDSMILQSS